MALVAIVAVFSGCASPALDSSRVGVSADPKRDRAECSKAAIGGPGTTWLGFPAFVSFDRDEFDRCVAKRGPAPPAGRQSAS